VTPAFLGVGTGLSICEEAAMAMVPLAEDSCLCGAEEGPICVGCLLRLPPGLVHLLDVSVEVPTVYATAISCSRMWLVLHPVEEVSSVA
jgi:hypothetical protein